MPVLTFSEPKASKSSSTIASQDLLIRVWGNLSWCTPGRGYPGENWKLARLFHGPYHTITVAPNNVEARLITFNCKLTSPHMQTWEFFDQCRTMTKLIIIVRRLGKRDLALDLYRLLCSM